MAITSITIQNFKGVGDKPITVEFKPITLLFGANSAGKSTVLHALHYAREVLANHNLDPGKTAVGGAAVDLGGFKALVHNHDLSRTISIKIDLDSSNEQLIRFPFVDEWIDNDDTWLRLLAFHEIWHNTGVAKSLSIEFQVRWSEGSGSPFVESFEVTINDERLARIESTPDGKNTVLRYLNVKHSTFRYGKPDEYYNAEFPFRELVEGIIRSNYWNDDGKCGIPISTQYGALPDFRNEIHIGEDASLTPDEIDEVYVYNHEDQKSDDPHQQGYFKQQAWIQLGTHLQRFLGCYINGPAQLAIEKLSTMIYVGPLREIPPRNFAPSKTVDPARWANGLGAWDKIPEIYEHTELSGVNEWLSGENKLDTGYRIVFKKYREIDADGPLVISAKKLVTPLNSLEESLDEVMEDPLFFDELMAIPQKPIMFRIQLEDTESLVTVTPHDIGVGVSQVIPVLIASMPDSYGEGGRMILIEQPELHIHPKIQVALGDLFIEQSKLAGAQFILETHSEHLLLRLLRRIRETTNEELSEELKTLTPAQLAVNFFERTDEGIKVTQLEVNEDGDFNERWPGGFFEERIDELGL